MKNIILVLVSYLLVSCAVGDPDEYVSITSPEGFDGPVGRIVSFNIDEGKLTNNRSTPSAYDKERIEFASISGGTIGLSASDAVTSMGIDDASLVKTAVDGFYLSTQELSQEQWNVLIKEAGVGTAIAITKDEEKLPVAGISKDEIEVVLSAWNATHHFQLRLPSNNEWEYACRIGGTETDTQYAWGEQAADSGDYAQVETTGPRNVNSGTRDDNNLMNMHGNVWEWTSNSDLRGGSWNDNVISSSSGNRLTMRTDVSYVLAGVRLVIEVAQ